MASEKKNPDLLAMLQEAFDPEEFKRIFREMKPDSKKFKYYMDMLKLLMIRTKGGDGSGSTDIDKMLDDMFNPKKKD